MMFGHGETLAHRAHHIKLLRDIQDETGGFTEFVHWDSYMRRLQCIATANVRALELVPQTSC